MYNNLRQFLTFNAVIANEAHSIASFARASRVPFELLPTEPLIWVLFVSLKGYVNSNRNLT
jgi:hypothetical protein